MKISIIIPTKNSQKYLKKAVDSVVNQNYKNWEIIFIDKNSKDISIKIIQEYKLKYSNKIKLCKQIKGNLTTAMNLGINKSSGEIVAILGSDDIYEANIFFKIVSEFKNNNISELYGNTRYIDKSDKIIRKVNSNLINKNYIFLHKVICHQSFFIKKELFYKNGFLDEKYNFAADFEIIVKNIISEKYLYLNENIVKFRMSGNNITSVFWKEQLEEKKRIIIQYCPSRLLLIALIYLKLIYLKKYIKNLTN